MEWRSCLLVQLSVKLLLSNSGDAQVAKDFLEVGSR